MTSRDRRAAVDAYRDRLAKFAACVTDRPLLATGNQPAVRPHRISFLPVTELVPLRIGTVAHALALMVKIEYQVDESESGEATVRPVGYAFQILERQGREVLAYHWHPFGPSPVRIPHVHLSSRLPSIELGAGLSVSLGSAHLPTGFVSLADVVRLLIAEFGVEPRRPNWAAIVDTV